MSDTKAKPVGEKAKVPLIEDGSNARKIPKTVFIDDVESFVDKYGAPQILEEMNELYKKYQFMESQLSIGRKNLKVKLAEIKKTVSVVNILIEKHDEKEETMNTNFLISDNIWARAEVQNTGKIGVWLGANVMVEYSYDEALKLLNKNFNNADSKLKSTYEDLDYIKDQITTMEVNMARVYNQNVANKAKDKKQQPEQKAAKVI